MRKVVSGLFITLDGVVESPEKWSFDSFDEDMMVEMNRHIAETDAVLLGRATFQEWAPYWPTAKDEPYASFINSTPKYVVSTTLKNVDEWQNSTLISGDLAAEISKLKQQQGKNIGVQGSPTLVYSLLDAGLLDELTLMIYPVVAGAGRRLFKDGGALKRLELSESRTTRSGVTSVTYQPKPEK